ncbi:MAG: flagellar biosynthetic protein FliR [Nitrococcus sp.]|nr:flagellar biosynthetic protein FliR [Nitrococcus sp.]
MTITSAELTAWVGQFLWPFIRVGALMLTAPMFSNILIPVRVRVLFSVGLTVAVLPAVGSVPRLDPLSAAVLLVAGQQVLIGAAIGLLVAMAFQAVALAGETLSITMGLGFATIISPQTGVASPVISQFLLIAVMLLFLAVGGHLMLIELLAESFRTLPIATTGLGSQGFYALVAWAGQMFAGAVLLALPAIAVLLIVNLIIGVMTRAAPQMNVFSVGLPITLLAGFVVVLVILLPALPEHMAELWRMAFERLRQILAG